MIRIKSKYHNFRRCGIAHPAQAVEYPDGRFTPAELAILEAEPMLVVERIMGTDFKSVPIIPQAETVKAPAKSGKKGKR